MTEGFRVSGFRLSGFRGFRVSKDLSIRLMGRPAAVGDFDPGFLPPKPPKKGLGFRAYRVVGCRV